MRPTFSPMTLIRSKQSEGIHRKTEFIRGEAWGIVVHSLGLTNYLNYKSEDTETD